MQTNESDLSEFDGIMRAATIMPVRDSANGLEVLLVKRSKNLAFAPDAYVFPGGRQSSKDALLLDKSTPDSIAAISAIRECFEEIGYLFANDSAGNNIADKFCNDSFRERISINPKLFPQFMKDNKLSPSLEEIYPVAIWVPPENIPKRYLTWFFAGGIDGDTQIIVDNHEIVDYCWIKPIDALKLIAEDHMKALYPTRVNLSLLAEVNTRKELKDRLNCRNMPIIRPQTIDKSIYLRLEKSDSDEIYPYKSSQLL